MLFFESDAELTLNRKSAYKYVFKVLLFLVVEVGNLIIPITVKTSKSNGTSTSQLNQIRMKKTSHQNSLYCTYKPKI